MKIYRTAIFIIVAITILININEAKPMRDKTENFTPEQKEVWAVIESFNDAFEQNNPEEYFKHFGEELTVIIPSSPYRIDGLKDDRVEFEYSLNKGWTKVGYFQELQPKVTIYGETAVVTYYSRGAYGADNTKVAYLKETDVLVKRNQEWKIVHIHVSNTTN